MISTSGLMPWQITMRGAVPELVQASSDVAAALRAGALEVLPVHRFPLSDVAEAHEAGEAGVVGKVLLDVA